MQSRTTSQDHWFSGRSRVWFLWRCNHASEPRTGKRGSDSETIKSERETMESRTQRIEKWCMEMVAPAEGTHHCGCSRMPFLRLIRVEKVTMGGRDNSGFRRIWKYGDLESYKPWGSFPSADSPRKSSSRWSLIAKQW